MRRARALAGLVALVGMEAGALLALRAAGSVERWRVDGAHFGRWLDQAPPADIAAGLGRWVALGIAWWLVASTVLFLAASLTRRASLIRFTGAFTLPVARRAVTAGLGISLLLPMTGAFAQTAPRVWQSAPSAVAAGSTSSSLSDGPGFAPAASAADGLVTVAPSLDHVGKWAVAPGDNLWVIAEATIAHAQGIDASEVRMADLVPYWRTLVDASPEWRASDDPNLIFPGEVAQLPPYQWSPPAADPAPAPAAPPVTVPAPAPPGPAPTVPVPASVPVTAPAAQTVTSAPVATTAVTTAPEAQSPATALPGPDASDPAPVAAAPDTEAPAPGVHAAHSSMPTGLFGYGLLAAGIMAALNWRRRERGRRTAPGMAAPEPTPEEVAVETAVLVGADTSGARFVAAGLRALGAVAAEVTPGELAPLGVIAGAAALEIPMGGQMVRDEDGAASVEAPSVRPIAPFTGTPSRWRLERPGDLDALERVGEGVPIPVPALVSLGKDAAGAEVLVDLEDAGMVAIAGDGAAEVVTAAGLALACPPWDEAVDLLCVGFDSPPPGARVLDALDDAACAELERDAQECALLLESTATPVAGACRSTLEARIAGLAPDTWVPTVVCCAGPLPPAVAQRLVGMVNDRAAHGVAVLAVGTVPGVPVQLEIRPDTGLAVDFLDATVVVPQRVRASEAGALRDLLDHASAEPVARVERPAPDPGTPEILVRTYGGIELTGPNGPLVFDPNRKGKATEAIVYLAAHDEVTSGAELRTALWPNGNGDHIHQIMYAARQGIGHAADGSPHIPKNPGTASNFLVGPGVATDIALIRTALDARDPERLRSALGLIRGRPFDTTGRGYEWATAEGLAVRAAEVAVDAAHALVDLMLEEGDTHTARWAAEQGLLASPGSEPLLRALMRAEAAAGNRTGVEAAYERIIAAAEEMGTEPSPVSKALRDDLLRPARELMSA